MFRLSRALCAFLLSFSSIGAMAADQKSGEIWVNAGSISHHFNRNYNFNERNWGFGAEYKFDARRSVFAGTYRNSMWRTTRYAGLSYTPFQIGLARIGMIGGVADGYREMNDGGFFPMISPVLSIEGKRFGMNFIIIPSIVSNVSSALALQVKIRIGT